MDFVQSTRCRQRHANNNLLAGSSGSFCRCLSPSLQARSNVNQDLQCSLAVCHKSPFCGLSPTVPTYCLRLSELLQSFPPYMEQLLSFGFRFLVGTHFHSVVKLNGNVSFTKPLEKQVCYNISIDINISIFVKSSLFIYQTMPAEFYATFYVMSP